MSVRVAAERAEEARALLIELFPEGFEEVARAEHAENYNPEEGFFEKLRAAFR